MLFLYDKLFLKYSLWTTDFKNKGFSNAALEKKKFFFLTDV